VGLVAVDPQDAFASPVEGCTFQGLQTAAARVHAGYLAKLGAATMDPKSVVQVVGGDVVQNSTMRGGVTYRLLGHLEVNRVGTTGGTGIPTLTIEAGAIVETTGDSEIGVGYGGPGTLKVTGTADKPVQLTSVDKAKGTWTGIRLYDQARDVSIEHAVVEYAKSADDHGAIHAEGQATGSVKDVTFQHLDGVGISVVPPAKVKTSGLKAVDAKAAEWKPPE
jgi:hypothetical protein